MKYALVQDGQIVKTVSRLPENYENTSGFAWLSQDELALRGFLPIVEVRPPLGPYESWGPPAISIEPLQVVYTYPVTPANLEAAKKDKVRELEGSYSVASYSGFESSALGPSHVYPSTLEAQLDLVGTVVRGKPAPFACVDAQGVKAARNHTFPQIQQVLEDGAAHKVALYTNLQTKLAAVAAAPTVAEVLAVAW